MFEVTLWTTLINELNSSARRQAMLAKIVPRRIKKKNKPARATKVKKFWCALHKVDKSKMGCPNS